MELRSNRSRSLTPFSLVQGSSDSDYLESGNHVEKTVVRTTRSTTVRANEHASSSSEEYSMSSNKVKPTKKSARSEKSVRNLYRTSDYSSEDGGENEVSSTRTISQNERNQLIEAARAAANGTSEVSALNLYIKSGRYWDVYPKTDWTYSQHSKDRVEIAPGVVAMPNMSRRTIHSMDSSLYSNEQSVAHKTTNTDTVSRYSSSELDDLRPRLLFNNNYEDTYIEKRSYRRASRWARIKRAVVGVFTSILSVLYYVYTVQTSWLARLHRLSSRVMLMDTWLLRKTRSKDKLAAIFALCLLPLILFGGWWLATNAGGLLYAAFNSTTPLASSTSEVIEGLSIDNSYQYRDIQPPPTDDLKAKSQKIIDSALAADENFIQRTEKVHVAPANPSEIAAALTVEQLDAIADAVQRSISIDGRFDTDEIVANIVQSSSFQNLLNGLSGDKASADLIENQQKMIDGLKGEINAIRGEILDMDRLRRNDFSGVVNKFRIETAQNTARLNHQLTRCCQKPVIDVEAHVTKILAKLLNDGNFLQNQQGLSNWLHTVFVAKQDLEVILANATQALHADFDGLLKDNGNAFMSEVMSKVSLEMRNMQTTAGGERTVGVVSDERIREIVKNTLTIYDADKTGLVDYAMEPMGGQVVTTRCTENYHSGKAVVSVLGIPLWYPVNSPRTVITPGLNPGECWAFQNFPGFLVVKLSGRVQIEALSLEHISKLLVPNAKIDSAPKAFQVYGLAEESDRNPVLLGEYVYDANGEPLQYFAVQNQGHVFEIIEIRVMSNHGNPNYTCLYRFRVHGKLIQP